ncbi:MAG: DUF523 domain-containing protein [Eubacteriales bacterium]|nr:DUF523 domain-containing protein [Eubacteriales bacterium]
MENLLVSACLLGVRCRYDGGCKPVEGMERLKERWHLIPVCPEIMGGLPTPRPPAERVGEQITTQAGVDVTAAYERGAAEALRLAQFFNCRRALLKERSPSCGAGQIYDGSFSGALASGDGVCAQSLQQNGIQVFGESQLERLITMAQEEEER